MSLWYRHTSCTRAQCVVDSVVLFEYATAGNSEEISSDAFAEVKISLRFGLKQNGVSLRITNVGTPKSIDGRPGGGAEVTYAWETEVSFMQAGIDDRFRLDDVFWRHLAFQLEEADGAFQLEEADGGKVRVFLDGGLAVEEPLPPQGTIPHAFPLGEEGWYISTSMSGQSLAGTLPHCSIDWYENMRIAHFTTIYLPLLVFGVFTLASVSVQMCVYTIIRMTTIRIAKQSAGQKSRTLKIWL